MLCDICNKEFKNVEAHKRMAHSKPKSEEEIGKILYDDVVIPFCSSHGIPIGNWNTIDKKDYLRIAKKIRGE